MGLYKYVRDIYKKPKEALGDMFKERLVQYRTEPVTVRIDRPTRLDRARSLGYRAKQGIFVVRQRVRRGGRMRPKFMSGRRPKAMRRKKIVNENYQHIAETRVQRKYHNSEVLGSYKLTEDGYFSWYEVIMVDKSHPAIKSDKKLSWITKPQHNKRTMRALTSASRKSRGLRKKGQGAEKVRPSINANKGRLH